MDKTIVDGLSKVLKGEVAIDVAARRRVRHDASIYELTPDAVVYPHDSADLSKLVAFVSKHKAHFPDLSLTPRAGGTDVSGGAIGSSIVVDMTKHFSAIDSLKDSRLRAQPGVFLRSIDPLLEAEGIQLGSAPVSRAVSTLGGMVATNASGEHSTRYGSTSKWVRSLSVILADGNEYTLTPLTKRQLDRKMAEPTFEGRIYAALYTLIEDNYDLIRNARPRVDRNTAGYALWDVWDRESGVFNLIPLIAGSQGTLGFITDITIEAVPRASHSGRLLVHLPSLKHLSRVIEIVDSYNPTHFEGYDELSFSQGMRHIKTLQKQLGMTRYLRQQAQLLASAARLKGLQPSLLLDIELDGKSTEEVRQRLERLATDLQRYARRSHIAENESVISPFWQVRHDVLSLFEHQLHGRYAVPLLDDMAVHPRHLAVFIPDVRRIIRKYGLPATIQGHIGDGTLHIIPLRDIVGTKHQASLEPAMRELIQCITKYGGSTAGEHGDGMVRGPWLPALFGQEVVQIFKEVKGLFDPLYIFNPYKKTDASWDYSTSHERTH